MAQQHPSVVWAQRKDRLFLTVDVAGITQEKHTLIESPGKITFSGVIPTGSTSIDLNLFGDILNEGSEFKVTGRNILFNIKKKEAAFWPRLTASKDKLSYVSIDWDKWVDEDEEDEAENFDWQGGNKFDGMDDMQGMGMGDMQGMGMGDMQGLQGMDFSSLGGQNFSDEEMPKLDDVDAPAQ